MTRVRIVPKEELSTEQLQQLNDSLSNPIHSADGGMPVVWVGQSCNGRFAIIDEETNFAVGAVECSSPLHEAAPSWWVDSRFREQGFGYAMVDALVPFLKERGYSGIGHIRVQTRNGLYDEASRKLVHRFCELFNQTV